MKAFGDLQWNLILIPFVNQSHLKTVIQITEEENGLKLTFSIMPARART